MLTWVGDSLNCLNCYILLLGADCEILIVSRNQAKNSGASLVLQSTVASHGFGGEYECIIKGTIPRAGQ